VQHDIDDAVRAGLLTIEQIPGEFLDVLGTTHSQRIATLVIDTIYNTRHLITNSSIPLVEPGPETERALWGLREFMFETIYRGSVCQAERSRAMFIIEHLYDYYKKFPDKMSPLFLQIAAEEGIERAVVDYISGMSDAYCISLFKDIYIPQSLVPEAGRVFGTKDDPVIW